MLKFIVKRLLAAIPTLLLALTLIFFLMRALPGDPLYALLGALCGFLLWEAGVRRAACAVFGALRRKKERTNHGEG